ncbi:MAG: amidophosphoribosyltransferase, partial [[Mycobacterium] stephanolepidis]
AEGMVAATQEPRSRLCCACFDGHYPIELPKETALGKNVVENMLAATARETSNDSADSVQAH